MAEFEPIKVLIADDHPVFRDGLARAIERRPELELVGEASDGRETLALARDLEPDVAVLDTAMSKLGGRRLLEALRSRGQEARVLVLSAQSEGELVYDTVCEGAMGFITKRANGSEICEGIVRVARGERLLDSRVDSSLMREIARRANLNRPPALTPRELEVLRLSAEGHSTRKIGKVLHLSPETVKSYLSSLFEKLEVSSRAAAVAAAFRRGLLD